MKLMDVLNEQNDTTPEKKFEINKKKHKFQLFLDNILVAESGFRIEQPDEFFNQKYIYLFNLKTSENFRSKGYMKYLLEQIFNYIKNEIKINLITLIVYKVNTPAINLYFNTGFEIYREYHDSYSLIKKLS